MRFNDTASAYGLFQVVFADAADHLAVATHRLRVRKEPGLTEDAVFRQRISDTLRDFRKELDQFDNSSAISDSVRDLRDASDTLSTLSLWRNDRIHARVQMTENGYALYDKRTRERLDLSREEIETNIEMLVKVIVTFKSDVQHLVGQLEWDAEFEKMFRELTELSEPSELFEAKTA